MENAFQMGDIPSIGTLAEDMSDTIMTEVRSDLRKHQIYSNKLNDFANTMSTDILQEACDVIQEMEGNSVNSCQNNNCDGEDTGEDEVTKRTEDSGVPGLRKIVVTQETVDTLGQSKSCELTGACCTNDDVFCDDCGSRRYEGKEGPSARSRRGADEKYVSGSSGPMSGRSSGPMSGRSSGPMSGRSSGPMSGGNKAVRTGVNTDACPDGLISARSVDEAKKTCLNPRTRKGDAMMYPDDYPSASQPTTGQNYGCNTNNNSPHPGTSKASKTKGGKVRIGVADDDVNEDRMRTVAKFFVNDLLTTVVTGMTNADQTTCAGM